MARMVEGMEKLVRGEIPAPPVAGLLGLHLATFTPGESVVELPVSAGHTNPMGTVQGGIVAALADAAMGWAYMTTLGDEATYTTLEMKINFLKPVWQGRLSARARVRKGGRVIGLVECDVLDDEGKLVAHALSTCMTLTGEQASGR